MEDPKQNSSSFRPFIGVIIALAIGLAAFAVTFGNPDEGWSYASAKGQAKSSQDQSDAKALDSVYKSKSKAEQSSANGNSSSETKPAESEAPANPGIPPDQPIGSQIPPVEPIFPQPKPYRDICYYPDGRKGPCVYCPDVYSAEDLMPDGYTYCQPPCRGADLAQVVCLDQGQYAL